MVRFPEPAERWLRPLGLAMIALSVAPFTPWMYTKGAIALPAIIAAFPVVMLGVALVFRKAIATTAIVSIVLTDLAFCLIFFRDVWMFSIGVYSTLNALSWTLTGAAQPYVWGSALVRREHPACVTAWKVGRTAATTLLVAFGLGLASEVLLFAIFPSMATSMFSQEATAVLLNLLGFVSRVLLFWGSVESLRRSREPAAIQSRADRVHILMGASVLTHGISIVVLVVHCFIPPSTEHARAFAWHSTARLALFLAATILLARRYLASPDLGPRWTAPPPLPDEAA